MEARNTCRNLRHVVALGSLDNDEDINRAWGTIRENIKIPAKESLVYYELKQHKQWFSRGCSKLLDQRKQATLEWLQDASQNKWG
jgi:hypothetical protein